MNHLQSLLLSALVLSSACIVDTRERLPPPPTGADTYEECATDGDCGFASDYCQPLASSTVDSAICSVRCFDNRDCPTTVAGFEGVCLPIGAGDAACVESCSGTADCAAGFACEVESVTGFDYQICIPR